MILQHPRPDTSPDAIARRKKANDQARAANIRQGYKLDPRHEADMDRVVAGEITLDQLREETLARYRQPHQSRSEP